MKHRYECLMAIDSRGQEDSVKEIIERLEADFVKEGAEIEQVKKWTSAPWLTAPAISTRRITLISSLKPTHP